MTLDDCIKWHSDEAEKLKDDTPEYAGQCKQIANWLTELKERRAADVQPVDRWIRVEESKPKDMQQVLAVVDGDVREAFYNAGCFIGSNFYRSINEVKRWQPLPEPPKED